MSRSYKKVPIYHSGGWLSKKEANRIVRAKLRRTIPDADSALPQGARYRRVVEQYDINDYTSYWPIRAARKAYRQREYFQRRFRNEKAFIDKCWAKNYRRK